MHDSLWRSVCGHLFSYSFVFLLDMTIDMADKIIKKDSKRKKMKTDDKVMVEIQHQTEQQEASSKQTHDEVRNEVAIKSFIQRTCTPVSYQKRVSAVKGFLKHHFDDKRTVFTQKELEQIWKGIFYAIWYTEMGKGCEDLIHVVSETGCHHPELLSAGFSVLVYEWKGIDAIRLDKFAYLTRTLVNAGIKADIRDEKNGQLIESLLDIVRKQTGLLLHFTSVYVEEVFKILVKQPLVHSSPRVMILASLMKPIIGLLTYFTDDRIFDAVSKEVLLESLVETVSSDYDFTEKEVLKYKSYLIKMSQAFKESTDSSRHQKSLQKVIDKINDAEEMDTLLKARDIERDPMIFKKEIKRLTYKE